jgi:hypothetical protein
LDDDRELVSVHALESKGVNEIPAAFAKLLSVWLGSPSNESTLANLIGFIESQGGHVVGATVLTGKTILRQASSGRSVDSITETQAWTGT